MRIETPVHFWDRRGFLGLALSTSATAVVTALVPAIPISAAATKASMSAGDRSVDDQWSGYPRYAEAIRPGRPAQAVRPAVDPVDEFFVDF